MGWTRAVPDVIFAAQSEPGGATLAVSKKIREAMEGGSWIRRMFEAGIALKQQYGEDKVFDLSLGNPVTEPPEEFRKELLRLAQEPVPGMHRYMPNAGYDEVRAAVADQLSMETGISFSKNDIVMTCGAAGALNVVLKTLLNPGDEVILFAPYFVEYGFYCDNHGGQLVTVPTRENFQLDLSRIEEALNPKTRAVLINSPNNPTGQVYPERDLLDLGKILDEKSREIGRRIYLISDEPYRDIVYDDVEVPSLFKVYPHSIITNSYSKNLSIPGERIGYVVVHPEAEEVEKLLGALNLANRILGFVNAPALMQRLVKQIQGVCVDKGIYEAKRNLLCDGLKEAGYEFSVPAGAFYVFPKSPIPDDVEFVKLLQDELILAVPGSGFGGPGYFRLAYCVDDDTIKRSFDGFKRALEKALK